MGTINLLGRECEFSLDIDGEGWANGILTIEGETIRVGGGWIYDETQATEKNNCCGYQPQHGTPGYHAGDLDTYDGHDNGDIDDLTRILGVEFCEAVEAIQAATEAEWERMTEDIDTGDCATVAALCRATEPAEVMEVVLGGKDLGRYAWDNADDRRKAVGPCGAMEGWPTCECLCDCTEPAVTTDDGGTPVCDECETAVWTEDGDVICARQTKNFERCHVCGDKIDWGCIETHSPGTANSRTGTCGCGDAWLDEDKGGWGHYSYGVPEAADAEND